MAGVPYAVICRQAFGVFGANIPAVIRGLIAFAWYGIQTYLAANALMLVLLKFWPSLASLTSSSFLGLSTLGWLCFATMWLLQAMVQSCIQSSRPAPASPHKPPDQRYR